MTSQPLITLFTSPKPFTNPHIDVIQRNAIRNWKALGPKVEIFLVGEEEGVKEAAAEFEVGFIPNIVRNSSGTPRIDSIFELTRKEARSPLLAYINADILLLTDFVKTIEMVHEHFTHFLIVGQRWDLDVKEELIFEGNWEDDLLGKLNQIGRLHTPVGSDYFVFERQDFTNIPPFAVGRAGWDNWMLYEGRIQQMKVIDASRGITLIHQNHDYSHLPGGQIHRLQPESLENIELMGGRYAVYSLLDANYRIEGEQVLPAKISRWKLLREISILPAVRFRSKLFARIFYFLFNMKRALRDYKRDQAMKAKRK